MTWNSNIQIVQIYPPKTDFQCCFYLILCLSKYEGVFDMQSISLMNFTYLPSKSNNKNNNKNCASKNIKDVT